MKIKGKRKGCVDVYNAFLVKNAEYEGFDEIPIIYAYKDELPKKLTLFSKRKRTKKDSWLCFYEDDVKFKCLWNNPKKYLSTLSSYDGVILPDFSVYRDMPRCVQVENIYRSRAIGTWLQNNDVKVIPNIRWGDERTYDVACAGISRGSIISIGTHGLMKEKEERREFIKGLDYVIQKIQPKTILIYGSVPDEVFQYLRFLNVDIVNYPSEISNYYKRRCL